MSECACKCKYEMLWKRLFLGLTYSYNDLKDENEYADVLKVVIDRMYEMEKEDPYETK